LDILLVKLEWLSDRGANDYGGASPKQQGAERQFYVSAPEHIASFCCAAEFGRYRGAADSSKFT
jgi:hypothetical protein